MSDSILQLIISGGGLVITLLVIYGSFRSWQGTINAQNKALHDEVKKIVDHIGTVDILIGNHTTTLATQLQVQTSQQDKLAELKKAEDRQDGTLVNHGERIVVLEEQVKHE